MATLSASRRNSASGSTSNSPRPSISGNLVPKMSSLNEEEPSNTNQDSVTIDNNSFEHVECDSNNIKTNENINSLKPEEVEVEEVKDPKATRNRICSERSDSGISDCSIHQINSNNCTCNNTPLLSKKLIIDEEPEQNRPHENGNENGIESTKRKTSLNLLQNQFNKTKEIENKQKDDYSKTYTSLTKSGKVKEKIELFKTVCDNGINTNKEIICLGLDFKEKNIVPELNKIPDIKQESKITKLQDVNLKLNCTEIIPELTNIKNGGRLNEENVNQISIDASKEVGNKLTANAKARLEQRKGNDFFSLIYFDVFF